MVSPLFRKAISCRRRLIVSKLYVVVSKIVGSAQNVTVVPVLVGRLALLDSGAAGFWFSYGWRPVEPVAVDLDLEPVATAH